MLKEGEVGPQKGTKQQKVAKDAQDRRSQSVDNREEQNRADVRMTQMHMVSSAKGGRDSYPLERLSPRIPKGLSGIHF